MLLLSLLRLTAFLTFAAATPISYQKRDVQTCNANADLCSIKYSNVSFVGTHDSAFVGDLDDPRVNQVVSVTDQLNQGVRFLQAQTHKEEITGTLSMCHTSCLLLNSGSLEDYLTTVKKWLDANENALVTMLLTNGDNVDVSEFGDVVESVGLKDYAFVPSTSPKPLSKDDWPTMGEMINDGKRFVLFLDYGADESTTPFVLDEFSYFFETPFDVTDASFSSCSVDRPPKSSPDGKMYIVNHFLDKAVLGSDILVPDNDADFQTNAATGPGSIGAQVKLCEGSYGRSPNVVLLDMFNRGDWLPAQQAMNENALAAVGS
jgi:hypothetical protein